MKPKTDCESRDMFVWLRDMILYVALRWKSILLVALAVAIAVTGVKFWLDTNRYNSIEKSIVKTPEEPAPITLDDQGLAHVALVQKHQRNYEALCKYNTTAPMMDIDFQKVPTQRLSYLMMGSRSYEASLLLRECLADEQLYAALAEELSTEEKTVTAAHLAELVTTKTERDSAQNGDGVFVHIQVIAPNKKLCGSLAEVVRKATKSVSDKARAEIGYIEAQWVFDQYGAVRSDGVRDKQLDRLAEQELAYLDLEKAKAALTDQEEDYLFVSDRKEEPTKSYPAPTISKGAAILGFFGGIFVTVVWYVLRYLFCGLVLSAAEMQARYGLTVFGVLPGEKKVDWLRKCLQDKADEPLLLWHRMALLAQKAGVHAVYAVGDPNRLEGLTEVMAQQGIALQIGASPLANPETMAAVAQTEALILTADLEITRHQTVAAELELAQQLGCQPLGVVLVKE